MTESWPLYWSWGSMCVLMERLMLEFLSFSHGIPALLTSVGRGHKEQDSTAGHCGAEASTADHIYFSWCSGDCILLFEAGHEMGIVKWGEERLKVMERAPAWQKIQGPLTAVLLALEAGCSWCLQVPPLLTRSTPQSSQLKKLKKVWRSCNLLQYVFSI